MKLYKCLNAQGVSQYQGHQWPVPGGGVPEEYFLKEDADDQPGDWVELDPRGAPLGLCSWGLHGWRTLEVARRQTPGGYGYIYEMELEGSLKDGTIVQDTEKACGYRARLTKLVEAPSVTGAVEQARPGDYVWQ